MKKIKAIISALLVVIMLLITTLSAFAADNTQAQLSLTPVSTIYFDTTGSGWDTNCTIYVHIWEAEGDSFFNWCSKEEVAYRAGDNMVLYTFEDHDFYITPDKEYRVIFANELGQQTSELKLTTLNIHDTVCRDSVSDASPSDDNKSIVNIYWKRHPYEKGYLLKDKFFEKFGDEHYPEFRAYEELYHHYDENNNLDWLIFNGYTQPPTPAYAYGVFGDKVLLVDGYCDHFPLSCGVYFAEDDSFVGIEKIYNDNTHPEIQKVFESLPLKYFYLIGDLDKDKIITIMDATIIQRCLAKIDSFDDYQPVEFSDIHRVTDEAVLDTFDVDHDLSHTIMDATAIQRKLAKLDKLQPYQYYPVTNSPGILPLDYVPCQVEEQECSNNSYLDYDFNEYFYPKNYNGDDISSVTTIFKTYDEYAYCFKNTFEKFDRDFFKTKSLVYLYREYSGVTALSFNGMSPCIDTLYVNTTSVYMSYLPKKPENCGVFISVDKSLLKDITKIALYNEAVIAAET